MDTYDLIVIGSGPAGEKAAVKAAYFGYKVAVIEKEKACGGAGVNTGTLPSKTLKETALYYSGDRDRGMFGVSKVLGHEAGVQDFMYRKNIVTKALASEVEHNLDLHRVDLYKGMGVFRDKNTVEVCGKENKMLKAKFVLIATGSYPSHPSFIPFDQEIIHDSDTILSMKKFPKSICILGAGVIGCEYATIFAKMGVRVYLINRTDRILPFLDSEITESLVEEMGKMGVHVLFNTSAESVERDGNDVVKVKLSSGKELETEMFLFAAGRKGQVDALNLGLVGVESDSRGQISVDKNYQTSVPNIYAVGDVIGFPALASTSMDQGRIAVEHMFHTHDTERLNEVLPFGIYTVPEVSMVGLSESEAQAKEISYCTGVSYYKDSARGRIMGIESGLLKLVFEKDSHVILGVHVIGDHATELIHYGMYLIERKVTVDELINKVFNYPTLHDLYKYAAYDGLGNLSGHKIKNKR